VSIAVPQQKVDFNMLLQFLLAFSLLRCLSCQTICSADEASSCGSFAPEYFIDNRTRPHPLVQILNEGTTAMAAKFKSMSVRTVEIYYDDGTKEGVEQAQLKPGQESTTNTYEGHRFFVTPSGNKNKVLSRFTISKEKVMYLIEDPEYPAQG
jgi:hypothetical protein